MSVFFIANDSNIELKVTKVEENSIDIAYDRIEAMVDRELSKFNNTFFEVYDEELESMGWIVINDENEEEIIKTVKNTIDKINGVEITIDKMPNCPLGIYNYEFKINIKGVFHP